MKSELCVSSGETICRRRYMWQGAELAKSGKFYKKRLTDTGVFCGITTSHYLLFVNMAAKVRLARFGKLCRLCLIIL
jgi:hypothetical protein